jgi:hypothetical protein
VRLEQDELIAYIDEAYALGTIGQVIFTGGEPTLLGDALLNALAHASSLGLLTRVVTNGWWGVSPDRAVAYVRSLQAAGLTEINISVDDLHQQWIPAERVRHAYRGCLIQGLNCLIAHKQLRAASVTKDYLEKLLEVELIDFEQGRDYSADEGLRLFSSGTVVPVGRQPAQPIHEDDFRYGSFDENCPSILQDIVLDPYHDLLACCGIVTKGLPELTLGSLKQRRMLDILAEANNDVVLNWLALEGPAAIAEFVNGRDPAVHFAARYVNRCHLCNALFTRGDVRRVLHQHIHEVVDRVSLHREFLEAVRPNEKLMRLYCRE